MLFCFLFISPNMQSGAKKANMRIAIFLILLIVCVNSFSQLKSSNACGTLMVDVYQGWINKARPNDHPEQIKAKLPCYTSFQEEGNQSTCGGGVYYENRDMRFMVQRDYVVIGDKCKDSFNLVLFGKNEKDLFSDLGLPKLKDANWRAYQMAYGTLILFFNDKQVVNKVIITTRSTDDADLCNEMN
jgi:hypothetical protein